MNRETHNMLTRLERIGISADDALSLRRIDKIRGGEAVPLD